MSLGIVINGPEGLVLAAESRVTLQLQQQPTGASFFATFDNATKLLTFSKPHIYVGVVTYGVGAIGLRTASSYLPEFEVTLPEERLSVEDFAQKLSTFFTTQWNLNPPASYSGPPMTFVVGGFDESEPYGRVYLVEVPTNPAPALQRFGEAFGITWGGQREIVDRLLQGYDAQLPNLVTTALGLDAQQQQALAQAVAPLQLALPMQVLALQDCVNLALFFVRTTISAQNLTASLRGVGGSIDVATITRRDGLAYVQRKQITGERA